MKKVFVKVAKLASTLPALLFSGAVFAQQRIPTSQALNLSEVIDTLTDWLLGIGGGLAALILIIGGIRYIAAAGNEKQITQAKNTIIYAIVGLVIIVLAFVIERAVVGAFKPQ